MLDQYGEFVAWCRETVGWNDSQLAVQRTALTLDFVHEEVNSAWWMWRSATALKQDPRPVVLKYLIDEEHIGAP